MKRSRIAILDGFRAVAILPVLFFHFFSRWTPPENQLSLYPYGNDYNYFRYGYLGVDFFFMISGFVIFYTLDNTSQLTTFWKKRIIRLLPSMVFATLLTFVVFGLFDHSLLFPKSHLPQNLLPSLTFINPNLLNNVFNSFNVNFDYVNGSYWSLWPEIQFYLLASVLFYSNKSKFARNFFVTSTIIILVNHLFVTSHASNLLKIDMPVDIKEWYSTWFSSGFNLVIYLPFFLSGMLFYMLFKHKENKHLTSLALKIGFGLLMLYIVYMGGYRPVRLAYLAMFLIFFGFIYIPDKLFIFENRRLTNTGESSYFLYLIHENIGVLIIYSVGQYFLPFGPLFTLLLMYLLILFSRVFTFKVDRKITGWLKTRIAKH